MVGKQYIGRRRVITIYYPNSMYVWKFCKGRGGFDTCSTLNNCNSKYSKQTSCVLCEYVLERFSIHGRGLCDAFLEMHVLFITNEKKIQQLLFTNEKIIQQLPYICLFE